MFQHSDVCVGSALLITPAGVINAGATATHIGSLTHFLLNVITSE